MRNDSRKPRQHSSHISGFTLLELLVVIAIIGLLSAYVGPKYFSKVGESRQKVAKAQIESFSKALDNYRLDVGRYPNGDVGLNALLVRPVGVARWNGPYLQKALPMDPWGNAYIYRIPGRNGKEFDLSSLGEDGRAGGTGEAADVSN
ncbi:type II secretion system major pseudopilin GspG [Undibacterium sp. CY18W]|uniref:Type II secretion system core protein G n=1 Tax=Undibacterium hunanense TaxID=2762292 RepID=A0ABR6ZN29_9BURK|nr:type II secretion system major pseudopilin GspG [Undibacterium hunanense]MBC3917300.1 type II secretion system major pseudopilin GspG [Undibacterium hunanense]